MESTRDNLLTSAEITREVDKNKPLNPIDRFILFYEPRDTILARRFKEDLTNLIKYVNKQ